MNSVTLIGNLGADPEVRFTTSGTAVCNFRVATTNTWRDPTNGDKKEATQWHRIVAWGKQAENCGEYLKKGRKVAINGRLENRKWIDRDGNTRWTTEVVAQHVEFLGTGRYQQQGEDQVGYGNNKGEQRNNMNYNDNPAPVSDEDVPF